MTSFTRNVPEPWFTSKVKRWMLKDMSRIPDEVLK
jgi:hypothetical protein